MTLGFDPRPFYGNPEEIDALALRLAALARKVQHGADGIDRAMRKMEFEGPKARQLRQRSTDDRRRAEEIVARLQGLSHTAFQSADHSRQKLYELELAEQRIRESWFPQP